MVIQLEKSKLFLISEKSLNRNRRQIIIHIVSNGAFRRALTYSERITSLNRLEAEILACFYFEQGAQNRSILFFLSNQSEISVGNILHYNLKICIFKTF